jgi:hypothetical protein
MGWSGGGSVNIDDATLIKNTQGQIEVNLANANTWTATQTFSNGYQVNVASVSASGNISTNINFITANASSGAFTLTLPSATGSGRQYTIIKTDSSTNFVSIRPSGSDTIDGMAGNGLTQQYDKTSLVDIASGLWTELGFRWTGIQGYIPITITNSQSTATSTNFQANVSINLYSFSGFISPNLSNLYFSSDEAGLQVLNSWMESGSNTGTAIWWVLLPNGIAANSSITIYLQVDNITNNNLNTTTTGVAPQLTSTYAQYDNGAKVFNIYENFAGTSLPSGWQEPQTAGVSINNGISFNPGTSWGYVETSTANVPINSIAETNFNVSTIGYGGMMLSLADGGGAYTADNWVNAGSSAGEIYNGYVADLRASGGSGSVLNGTTNGIAPFDTSGSFIGGGTVNSSTFYEYKNYAVFASSTSDVPAAGNYYAVIGGGGNSVVFSINWFRTRAYPPNGVMPSVSVGSLTIT